MKLTEIAIDGMNHFRNLRLGRFADGLNFIYGENSGGKTSLRRFVRSMLFGCDRFDGLATVSNSSDIHARGHLTLREGAEEFQLDRDLDSTYEPRIHSRNGASPALGNQLRQRLGDLNPSLYDSIFNFSFRQTADNAPRLNRVLQTQFRVPCGSTAASVGATYENWQRESSARTTKLQALQQRSEHLKRQRAEYLHELESESSRRSRLAEVEEQLESVAAQISSFEMDNQRNQLVKIDREISELRILIDETIRRERLDVATLPAISAPVGTAEDPFSSLYQRLDEIDHQIRRWRRVQTDIQTQRVRLKDEMVVWNDLTLESNEHPYHNAREILVALEQKVDATQRHANQWNSSGGQRDASQLARTIQDLCQNMRDDLYGLCQELAQQYKHIRHKAAAAELKQLRRCYQEMGENTDRLVRRREAVIHEIRQVDPAGAEAIVRSELGFCHCAMHEGYLEARRRFVGLTPVSKPANPRVVRTDLSEPRQRLELLERQRQEVYNYLSQADRMLPTLKSQHAQLIQQRDALRRELVSSNPDTQLERIDAELQATNAEIRTLLRLMEDDQHLVRSAPNPVLSRAAQLLNRLTNGELTQVWLSDVVDAYNFQVRSRSGNVLSFAVLDAAQQDQVYLSLAVATKESMRSNIIDLPMLIDDAFANIAGDRIAPTLDLLVELAAAGHQMIVLTQHRYLADRIPGCPLFELPPSTGFTQPILLPERSLPFPGIPDLPASSQQAANYLVPPAPVVFNYDSIDGIESGLTYPYSKYRTDNDVVEFRDRVDYIVPYPGTGTPPSNPYPSTPARSAAQSAVPVSVSQVGEPLGYVLTVDDRTLLDQLELFDLPQLRALADLQIETIGQLLDLDPEQLPAGMRDSGITSDQLNRWQSYVWLLSNIPGLRTGDARILVACGVTEPEHLATSHGQQLYERIQRFLASSEGQRFASPTPSISLDRINGWHRALNSTRARWQRPQGLSRVSRRQFPSSPRTPNTHSYQPAERNYRKQEPQSHEPIIPMERQSYERRPAARENFNRDANDFRPRDPFVARPPRMQTPTPQTTQSRPGVARSADQRTTVPPMAPLGRPRSVPVANADRNESTNDKHRFYLDPKDHIEAAPSIGPKTAERFEKIGVSTVADFLKQTAESMAAKLKYKRITADLVRAWQHQTRLVCRIPNLRGHDAQLLVACDFTEPETIATMQPKQLLDIIGPFAATKDGQKIIRTGKNPDLAEVTDWIAWAAQTRSLQAA